MATFLLAAVGSSLGGLFGGFGAVLGQAIAGIAGAAIDSTLIRSSRTITGSRLSDLDVQTSTEGEAIPRVYGRARIAGQVIWATRLVENSSTSGGKGGVSVRTYSYHANFAVGLCEGPIHHIGRVWADGSLLDTTTVTMRVHLGGEDQEPDPFILARQGEAPAYRGLAYVVFEALPLEDWGNSIPQLTFEVIRVVDTLEGRVRAVTLIPGSTEFGYDTTALTRTVSEGVSASENRHTTVADTDFLASLDELTALCPNLRRVALVVSWFGDDLRAGSCRISPAVDAADKQLGKRDWKVAGLHRADAPVVSRVDGRAAYGGTPSDHSVVAAIREMRSRGLEVMLYPFVSMDIAAGNGLPDPYGGSEQPAFPWRGRITCHPAPGHAGSPDGTATAATEVAALVGTAAVADYTRGDGTVSYDGPVEWTLRRMILHYANLAAAAGGVDAFLIGSEFVGLSTVRGSGGSHPFVDALVTLAVDVRAVLSPSTRIGYAADWSEWFGHHPADGSGDVLFHLDPLWASPAIDFVGIDAYFPLTDWREGAHLDAALADVVTDPALLAAGCASGEGWDWYYADDAARRAQIRTPIVDTARGEDWIFRPKDLAGWWSNFHHERIGGVVSPTPTAWAPGLKPIWFTELGCPAVDLGANQPNVFPDAKSSEGALPHFSAGARDDLMQRRMLEAVIDHWSPTDTATNPVSTVYGGPMLPADAIHLWTWDARPYPAFPTETDVWSDGASWRTGHWLNGRLGGTSLDGLIRAVLADHGIDDVAFRAVSGHVDGFVIDRRMSARDALDALLAAFPVDAVDTGTALRFMGRARRPDAEIAVETLVARGDQALVEVRRTQESELPLEVSVAFSDAMLDHRRTTVTSRRLAGAARRTSSADLAVVAPPEVMVGVADTWLADLWAGRTSFRFAVDPTRIALEPGDIVDLVGEGRRDRILIESLTDGSERAVEARSHDPGLYRPVRALGRARHGLAASSSGAPVVRLLDLAHPSDDGVEHRPWIAAFASPWRGSLAVWRSERGESYSHVATLTRAATMGVTTSVLTPGPSAVWDRATRLDVRLYGGSLASATQAAVLDGANRAAIAVGDGWEVIQFTTATLIAANTWRLSGLLRVQGGSDDVWWGRGEVAAGAAFVLLDDTVVTLPTRVADIGADLTFRIGPVRHAYTSDDYAEATITPAGRGLRPWSPTPLVLATDPATGDIRLSWHRRSRAAAADSWATTEVPLIESPEAYRVEIRDGGTLIRSAEPTATTWVWPRATRDADLGSAPRSVVISVAQIDPVYGAGIPRRLVAEV